MTLQLREWFRLCHVVVTSQCLWRMQTCHHDDAAAPDAGTRRLFEVVSAVSLQKSQLRQRLETYANVSEVVFLTEYWVQTMKCYGVFQTILHTTSFHTPRTHDVAAFFALISSRFLLCNWCANIIHTQISTTVYSQVGHSFMQLSEMEQCTVHELT